uniref:Putative secreted protein n=1 Tax=Anopheles darlingi TaxID=43151 RepID=A0A2M4DGQ9_ANODA
MASPVWQVSVKLQLLCVQVAAAYLASLVVFRPFFFEKSSIDLCRALGTHVIRRLLTSWVSSSLLRVRH